VRLPQGSRRSEIGHVILTVLGMVAQMERRFTRERQREGIERAKAANLYTGGKRRLDYALILELHASGMGPSAIAKIARCSRMQIYRVVRGPQAAELIYRQPISHRRR
jgi:DNA invertase Pin-like site-specific DNA recombinase